MFAPFSLPSEGRRTHSLPIFVRLNGRPVMLLGDGEAADAKRRLLERAGAIPVGEDGMVSLAVVALDEPDETVARLRARGVLVNAVDRPDLCDFTLPAIVDRDPVLVAIGTGGASAGLAKVLRQRIEALLPADLGLLATGLRAARGAIRARWPTVDQRRRAIDAALSEGGPLDPVKPLRDDAVAGWLAAPDQPVPSGLVVILLRSPDPDDLSLKEARLLGLCDRIYHRPDVPAAILDRARADAVRIAAAQPVAGAPGLTIDLGWSDR